MKIGVIRYDINFQKTGVFTMHNDFTLFTRKVPSGKMVVYYYAYGDEGQRLGPWTTGHFNRTAARNYCNLLNRKGKLLPGPNEIPTFAEFSAVFWDWLKSPYLKERKKRRELTQSYADKNKRTTEATLVPHFGKMKLDKITGELIDKWMDNMIAEEYSNATINSYYNTLQTMIRWAVKKRVIERDPFLDVDKLLKKKRDKKIITSDEFKKMFVEDWKTVWNNDFLCCTANKLAALTGMRCSEVLGLRGEYVFDDHIYLAGQYDAYGYRPTKTKIKHHIPLTGEMVDDLRRLMKVNGDGFVFSLDGGEKPVNRYYLYYGLNKAFNNIGITKDAIKERGLNIHAWRHFCNTVLQKAGLSIKKVQAVTGHKSEDMTDNYTHFDPADFGEVPSIQAELLKKKTENAEGKEPDGAENEHPTIRLVKKAVQETA